MFKTVKNTLDNAAVIVADRYLAPRSSVVIPQAALDKWVTRGGARLISAGSLEISDAPSRLSVPAAPTAVSFELLPTETDEVLDLTEEAVVADEVAVEATEEVEAETTEEESAEDKPLGKRRRGR